MLLHLLLHHPDVLRAAKSRARLWDVLLYQNWHGLVAQLWDHHREAIAAATFAVARVAATFAIARVAAAVDIAPVAVLAAPAPIALPNANKFFLNGCET